MRYDKILVKKIDFKLDKIHLKKVYLINSYIKLLFFKWIGGFIVI